MESLSRFHVYANCANKKLVKIRIVVRFLQINEYAYHKDAPFNTKNDKIDIPFKAKNPIKLYPIGPHVPVKAR